MDRFGNCVTNISRADLDAIAPEAGEGIRVCAAGRALGRLVDYFEQVTPGESGAIVGSTGHVELFCNQGNFAQQWRLGTGDHVFLQIAPVV